MLLCAFSSTAQIETPSKSYSDSISSYIATLIEDIEMRILKDGEKIVTNSIQQKIYTIFLNLILIQERLNKFNGLLILIKKGML